MHYVVDGDATVKFEDMLREGWGSVRRRKHAGVHVVSRTSSFESAQAISLKIEGHSYWEQDVNPLLLQTRDGHNST